MRRCVSLTELPRLYVETVSKITRGGYVLFFPAAVVNLCRHSLHWKTWRTLKRFNRLPFLMVNFEWQSGQEGRGCVLLGMGIWVGVYNEVDVYLVLMLIHLS